MAKPRIILRKAYSTRDSRFSMPKIELKIFAMKTIFFYEKHMLLSSFLPRDAMLARY